MDTGFFLHTRDTTLIFQVTLSKLINKLHFNVGIPCFLDNVKVKKWLDPQSVILQHPAVKLFISHGGAKSFKETICAKKPAIYVPLYADQHRNALSAKTWGFAQIWQKTKHKSQVMLKTALEVMEYPSYLNNVKRANSIWLDHIMPPKMEGVFWAEYIARHKGASKELRMSSLRLNFVQYWCLDVVLLLVLAPVILICYTVKLLLQTN